MAADAGYVLESYADYLLAHGHRKLWAQFRKRPREAQIAEAMVFRALQDLGANPAIADQPGRGGPDFLCLGGTPQQFMVEATSLLPDRVTKQSRIPNRVPEDMEGGAFGLLTAQIDETATRKRLQFKNLGMPGILAIASTHFGAPLLMDAQAAMNALISQPFWVVGKEGMSTDLKYSLFLRGEDGAVVAKNAEISAVILVAVCWDRSYLCGAVNPSPTFPLATANLWQVPFAYLKDWPVEKDRLRPMWTLGTAPKPHEIPHGGIR